MVLGAGQMQRVGRFKPESGGERRCSERNRRRHSDRGQALEKFDKVGAQHGIGALKRANQTFHFGQGRDGKPAKPGFSESQRDASAPNGMFLHKVDGDAGIEIDQSHDDRSSSISASISAAVRRFRSGFRLRSQSRMASGLPRSNLAWVGATGTSRTTGSPRLAITTSSPARAALINSDSRFLASKMLTCMAGFSLAKSLARYS